jgi:hypothetical protein
MEKPTKGPWKQGFTLSTPVTRRWSDAERAANDEREKRLVFAEFTSTDHGSGRKLVAVCETKEDARLIATTPDLLSELKLLYRAYVNLMESGRDRIVGLGGDCDPLDVMEANDPQLRDTRAIIAKAEGGAA